MYDPDVLLARLEAGEAEDSLMAPADRPTFADPRRSWDDLNRHWPLIW